MKDNSTVARRDAALVIVGHGSTVNPDSSEPTWRHAEEIRRRGLFREVTCCFWKEEPSMREVFDSLECEVVYVVPNFISEGYFCQEVLPRELGVTPPQSEVLGKTVRYCAPVGVHPNMTRLLLKRADEVAPGVNRAETSLIIVGHGTNLNENSTAAIKRQVELIAGGGYGFAQVLDAYMEEPPWVKDWDTLATAPHVVVVPFFIADGLHSYQDIPVLLGMAEDEGKAASQTEVFRHNPYELRGKKVFYSSAIGTEELMADVILDQVTSFDEQHGALDGALDSHVKDYLAERAKAGAFTMGQVRVTAQREGFDLRHEADIGLDAPLHPASEARQLAWLTQDGEFRPLKAAPTLKRGWRIEVADLDALRQALDDIYPGCLGTAAQPTPAVPLRDYLERQTGMYRFTRLITDDEAESIPSKVCASCGKTRLWGAQSVQEHPPTQGEVPLLCKQACSFVLGAARTAVRGRT
jgi:sirohydrochlorin cobaltochelatase